MSTRIARLTAIAAMIFLGATSSAQAQTPIAQGERPFPLWELSAGYQFLHVPEDSYPLGVNVDGAWNLSTPLGLVAELGVAFKSEDEADIDLQAWNVGVGPRWNLRRGKAWPYAQVLAGFLHARASGEFAGIDFDSSDTKFMLQPGAGIDLVVGDGWGIIGSVDYRRVFLDEEEDGESGENEFRIFVGLRMILD